MKTSLLIIIGIVIAVGTVTTIFAVEIFLGQLEYKEKVGGLDDTSVPETEPIDDTVRHCLENKDTMIITPEIGNATHYFDYESCTWNEQKWVANKNAKPSQWDFRTVPAYVLIPYGSASPEHLTPLIPKDITVFLGKNNTVTWVNEDDTPSTLVSDDGTWSTGRLLPGEAASVTFNHTGIYEYHGSPHPWKVGTVTVLED